MKKVIILICILSLCVIFSACFHDRSDEREFKNDWGFSATIWGNGIITNEETAILIATTYINELVEDSTYAAGYTFSSIKYDSGNEAYLVTFLPDEESNQLPLHVAIDKNGSVVMAWAPTE